jgi:hypothetical protein
MTKAYTQWVCQDHGQEDRSGKKTKGHKNEKGFLYFIRVFFDLVPGFNFSNYPASSTADTRSISNTSTVANTIANANASTNTSTNTSANAGANANTATNPNSGTKSK